MSNPPLKNLVTSLQTVAANDALKGLVPVLDNFLTNIQANQAGGVGLAADINALGPALLAALPQVGGQLAKDEAGQSKTVLDAAAAKAETTTAAAGTATAG